MPNPWSPPHIREDGQHAIGGAAEEPLQTLKPPHPPVPLQVPTNHTNQIKPLEIKHATRDREVRSPDRVHKTFVL